jgi:hypothetical protein
MVDQCVRKSRNDLQGNGDPFAQNPRYGNAHKSKFFKADGALLQIHDGNTVARAFGGWLRGRLSMGDRY